MSRELLDIYTDYLISQNSYATATELSNLLGGQISHNKITRFLNKDQFCAKDLWQYVKAEVHKQEKKAILIIDDSIEEKPYDEDGSTGILYLVTNDLDSDTDRIYEIYQKRWRIEEYHKSIKQNTSLEKSPIKVIRSQKNHIFASIIAYCKLEFLKIKTSLNHFALKYKLILKANQMAFNDLKTLCEKVSLA